jgi:peptidyl-prolyl cis-trans isomerase SurA
MIVKKLLLAAAAAGVIWTTFFPCVLHAESSDGIVAVVGNELILKSELDERELMARLQYPETRNDPQLRNLLLQGMIDQKIILTKAKIDSVTVDDSALDGMTKERFAAIRSRFASNQEMEARFGKSVGRITQGIRDELRNQQLIEILRRKKLKDVAVSYEETIAFYDSIKDRLPDVPEGVSVSQIIMYPMVSESARDEALVKIRDIQKKLQTGEDFAALARQYSSDPGSGSLGGDLGFVQKGELIQSFEDAAFALKPGQISDVVETRFGFHLIQLLDRENNSVHVRHILVTFDRGRQDASKTLELLLSIRNDVLAAKATFAEMARKYSDDPLSARVGGVIQSSSSGKSVFAPASLRPELQKIISGLKKPGEISMPTRVDPPKGEPFYAMFQLNERVASHRLSPEQDFSRLEELAIENKRQQLYNAWIQELKKEVVVRISDI